jgi:hypothetical protein
MAKELIYRDDAISICGNKSLSSKEAANLIRALPAVQPVAKVRALEWRNALNHQQLASCEFGYYVVTPPEIGSTWNWEHSDLPYDGAASSEDAAKAAAQADYEARILSALDAHPAPDLTANAALAAQLAEACARADRYEVQITAMSEELDEMECEIEALRKGGARND